MWDVLLNLTDAVQALDLVRALRTSNWAYPILNAAHVAGIGLLFGAIAVADVAILRRGRLDRAADALPVRIALVGFALATATGLVLFAVRASAYAQNPFMGIKFGLIALAGANALLLRWVASRSAPQHCSVRQRTAAGASLAIWTAAIGSGRMIGFW